MEGKLDTHIIDDHDEGQSSLGGQLPPGSILVNRYLVQDVLGVGGMGSVYRARDLHFPNVTKLVAVKEMINSAPDPAVRQSIVETFEREANILVTLSHQSIPKIFDYFTQNERSYLVLEYVIGKDLESLMNDTPDFFSEDQVIAWAIEICDVLEYLHTHKPEPIIFRDMKPSNVMINQHNRVVLIDFGIAKVFRGDRRGTMVGTEGYSPPEQYRGEASVQADLYALGATLHHMLTRRDPRLEAPFTFHERPVRQINPATSVELETVITTALSYNPQERFPSAQAMKEGLILAGHKTGALGRIPVHTTRISREPSVSPMWTFQCEDDLRGSPAYDNGILYIGAYDNNLYALQANSGQFIWKFATEGAITGRPLVSDGIVYIGSRDRNLYAITGYNGRLAWSHPTEGPISSSPRQADGHIFIGSDDGVFYAVNLATSRRSWRLETNSAIRSTAFVTGEALYFGNEDGEFFCVDFRGGVKWRFQAKRSITSSPLVDNHIAYFNSLDGMVYALDGRSGMAIWRYRMGKGSVSSPCKRDNYLYTGSADGNIYCLDSSIARELWHYKTDHQVSGSPMVYQDAVYCGSADGNLYCLESQTGRLRWKFATGGAITGTPIVYNDILYIGSTDHTVYAFEI